MFKDEIQALIERQPTKDISYKIEFDNQIYVHREHAVYPSASTIKVPIALINLQQHFHNYEDISLTVGKKVGGCGVLHTLESVKRLTLWDTIVLAIIISDNTASNMLIDNIGIDRINEGFTALGLHDTTLARNYYDTTGINEGKRNATSAADMFTSMKYVIQENDVLPEDIRQNFFDVMKKQQINDRTGGFFNIDEDHEAEFIASKTGSVTALEHEFGMIQLNGKQLIFSIFSNNWPTNQEGKYFLNEMGKIFKKYMN